MNERAGESDHGKPRGDHGSKDPKQSGGDETQTQKPTESCQETSPAQQKPESVPPDEARKPCAGECGDPETVLKVLKKCQKDQQDALIQAEANLQTQQQSKTGGEASLKQLEALLKSIKETHEKYRKSYEDVSEKVSESFCTYKSLQNYCECSDDVLALVDAKRTAIDETIKAARQSIDKAETEYESATADVESAAEALKAVEECLTKWINVDKQIAGLLKELDALAKKAHEARCDCCVAYFNSSEYGRLLKDKLCHWVRLPDELLQHLHKLWCKVKDAKEAASEATIRRDCWKRELDRARAELKALEASREQDILDAIAEIPECQAAKKKAHEVECASAT
jgi:septation ring formation regulator EzrA